jgi:hypothetical protein
LQYLNWTQTGIRSTSPSTLLHFVSEVHNFYTQQRSLMKPVIVHCTNGIGRSGSFCVIYAGIQEINVGHGIIPLTDIILQLRRQRKNMVENKEQLKFCYDVLLYYAQDLLMKRGILTSHASFGDRLPQPGDKSHVRKPSDDLILGQMNISSIQSSVAKLQSHHSSPAHVTITSIAVHQDDCKKELSVASEDDQSVAKMNQNSMLNELPASSVMKVIGTNERSGSSSPASLSNRISSNESSSTSSPLHRGSVTTEPAESTPMPVTESTSSAVLSLADLQNPKTFRMDVIPPSKKKITKANFVNSVGGLMEEKKDDGDPLSQLDPMWTIKNKSTKT